MYIEQTRVQEWVKIFTSHIQKIGVERHVIDEEGYKFQTVDHFQRHFNLEAQDILSMLNEAIPNNNLVVGSMYYPKKMLLHFTHDNPEAVRAALLELYDESKSVTERLTKAEMTFDEMMRMRNVENGGTFHSYISLRFLSLLLALRYPDKYNPLKPSEWRVFVKFLEDDFRMPKRLKL